MFAIFATYASKTNTTFICGLCAQSTCAASFVQWLHPCEFQGKCRIRSNRCRSTSRLVPGGPGLFRNDAILEIHMGENELNASSRAQSFLSKLWIHHGLNNNSFLHYSPWIDSFSLFSTSFHFYLMHICVILFLRISTWTCIIIAIKWKTE